MEAGNDQHPSPSVENPEWKVDIMEMKRVLEQALALCNCLLQIEEKGSVFDLANMEKTHIQRVLKYTKGNKVKAAKLLNIGITTIYRKLEEYGLE